MWSSFSSPAHQIWAFCHRRRSISIGWPVWGLRQQLPSDQNRLPGLLVQLTAQQEEYLSDICKKKSLKGCRIIVTQPWLSPAGGTTCWWVLLSTSIVRRRWAGQFMFTWMREVGLIRGPVWFWEAQLAQHSVCLSLQQETWTKMASRVRQDNSNKLISFVMKSLMCVCCVLDFAVGAPFHETGSVMIWTGSSEGISTEPSQVSQLTHLSMLTVCRSNP